MFRLTVSYANTEDAKFDFDYYRLTHIPMVVDLIGPAAVRSDVCRGMSGAGGTTAPTLATGHIYLEDLAPFVAAFEEHGARIMGDLPNFTNLAPQVVIEEIL